jgi:hypothetical protein
MYENAVHVLEQPTLAHQLFKCFELIELLMTMVLGSVKHNKCFFTLSFM